jgi:AraC-like DNA-binding protein/quercetin dioxygenase-like cupin family protein
MLSRVTAEEQAILDGSDSIDRELYMDGRDNTVNAQKLLAAGKRITIRPHTRFIHFPEHRHDYVEAVYMCAGESTHIVNGSTVLLRPGDLLFMSQSATHEILPTGMEDVAVNLIILPDFFTSVLAFLEEEETPLRRFLVDCLCGQSGDMGFLHFRSSGIRSIENLIENLLRILLETSPQRRKMSQMTMILLFLELMAHTEALDTPDREQATVFRVLSYIETHYAAGSLTELADLLHYDLYSLSREIKRKTGKTYTQLVQEKRLAQAAFLLKNTDRTVDQIAGAVGYENMGYFHRIFKETFGHSPRSYRLQIR